jgi:hypothetical protein
MNDGRCKITLSPPLPPQAGEGAGSIRGTIRMSNYRFGTFFM